MKNSKKKVEKPRYKGYQDQPYKYYEGNLVIMLDRFRMNKFQQSIPHMFLEKEGRYKYICKAYSSHAKNKAKPSRAVVLFLPHLLPLRPPVSSPTRHNYAGLG